MSRTLFGVLLAAVVLLYIWVAFQEVSQGISSGDWVYYVGAVLFLLALVGVGLAGMSLVRAKRR
jgi:hypothetical protein